MTWALEASVKQAEIPEVTGISPRAIRTVLAAMARVAQSDGTFRWGLRGSKVAALADYSNSVVRRVQRWAVAAGVLERVEVGGGRKATKWRIIVDALAKFLPKKTQQKAPPDRAPQPERHSPRARTGLVRGMFSAHKSRPRRQPDPVLIGQHALFDVCVHGGDGGTQPTTGLPRCPDCRRSA